MFVRLSHHKQLHAHSYKLSAKHKPYQGNHINGTGALMDIRGRRSASRDIKEVYDEYDIHCCIDQAYVLFHELLY